MIVWITSYPKSGNTWMRALLSAYYYSKDCNFKFDLLNHILNWDRSRFNSFLSLQDSIKLDSKTLFLKTHQLASNAFDNKHDQMFIYLVRDPRNIITSLANHYSITNEEAYTFIINKNKIVAERETDGKLCGIKTSIGSWSTHYQSWKSIKFAPLLIIRYEDLVKDAKSSLIKILKFIKMNDDINYEKIDKIISSCSFENLHQMEKDEGFKEAPPISATYEEIKHKSTFFYLGKKNNRLIGLDLEKRIIAMFSKEMKELNYEHSRTGL